MSIEESLWEYYLREAARRLKASPMTVKRSIGLLVSAIARERERGFHLTHLHSLKMPFQPINAVFGRERPFKENRHFRIGDFAA